MVCYKTYVKHEHIGVEFYHVPASVEAAATAHSRGRQPQRGGGSSRMMMMMMMMIVMMVVMKMVMMIVMMTDKELVSA